MNHRFPPEAGMPFSFDCQRVSLLLNDVNLTYGASFIFVQNLHFLVQFGGPPYHLSDGTPVRTRLKKVDQVERLA